jgi:hypothetical protein
MVLRSKEKRSRLDAEVKNVKFQSSKSKCPKNQYRVTNHEHEHERYGHGQRARTRNTNSERGDNGVLSRKTESVMKSKGYRNPANKNQETPVHRYLTTGFGRYYGSRVKVKKPR